MHFSKIGAVCGLGITVIQAGVPIPKTVPEVESLEQRLMSKRDAGSPPDHEFPEAESLEQRLMSKRDAGSVPDVKFRIPGNDRLGVWLYRNKVAGLPVLNSATLQPALDGLTTFLSDRITNGGSKPLNATNDEPLVWAANATSLAASQRLTVFIYNRPDGEALNTSTVRSAISGLSGALKSNPALDLDSAFIVQNDVPPVLVGSIGLVIGQRSPNANIASPTSGKVTFEIPNNSTLEIRASLATDTFDPATLLDTLNDAEGLVDEYAKTYNNAKVQVEGQSTWNFRKHAAPTSDEDKRAFQMSVTAQTPDAGWKTLSNVLDAWAHGVNTTLLYYGANFTVNVKGQDKALFNGTLQVNGPSPPFFLTPNLRVTSTAGRVDDSKGSHCNNDFANTDPSPFKAAAEIFSTGPRATYEFKNAVSYVYVPPKIGGKENKDKAGVTALFTPCYTGKEPTKNDRKCDVGVFGKDIPAL